MDNASDALIMAGSILLFIIALSIAVLSFSTAREAIDIRLLYADRESSTIANDSNYYYLASGENTNRYVGKETIIPAIYRSYKENFKIVFNFNDDDYYLFINKKEQDVAKQKVTKLDLVNQAIGNDLRTIAFLDGIIYNKYNYIDRESFINNFDVIPNSTSLYEYLSNKERDYKIRESIGVYYIEDLGDSLTTAPDMGTSNANKKEKRVITYSFEPNN